MQNTAPALDNSKKVSEKHLWSGLLEDFNFEGVAGGEGKGRSHMDRGDEFHFVVGIVLQAGNDNGPLDFSCDQNRMAHGAAK